LLLKLLLAQFLVEGCVGGEEFAQSLLFLFSWLVYLAADCYNAQYHQLSGSSFNLGGWGRDEYG